MEQNNTASETEEIGKNFIRFNTAVLLVFIIWWYNVISTFVFGHFYLSGEKQMFEIIIYNIGSFVLPLLYTFYILGHVQYAKIKKQSLHFKLIGIAWLPSLILLAVICYTALTIDNRVYFE